MRTAYTLAALVVWGWPGTVPVAAQDAGDLVLEGVVLDAAGAPATDTPVLLHRMSAAGGGLLAADTTDAEGRFAFSVPLEGDSAIHFAAASSGGALFVGPIVGPGAAVPDPYVIRERAGVPDGAIVLEDGSVLPGAGSVAADAAPPPPGGEGSDARRVALAFLGVAFLLAAGALAVRGRARDRALRRAVVELAELEARTPTPGSEERVAELRERAFALRPR